MILITKISGRNWFLKDTRTGHTNVLVVADPTIQAEAVMNILKDYVILKVHVSKPVFEGQEKDGEMGYPRTILQKLQSN